MIQQVYNDHLAISRKSRNKPFTIRKDFEGFENERGYVFYKKLDHFFKTYSNINRQLFFEAPYKIYTDVEYFPIEYYTTRKAVSSYNMYLKKLDSSSLNSDYHLNWIKSTLLYLKTKENLKDYFFKKTKYTYDFIIDYKERRLSPYVLACIPETVPILSEMNNEDKVIYSIKTYLNNLPNYKATLMKFPKTRDTILKILKNFA